ncbi:hypothetical protein HRbin18_00831 [bacterium HR18]|nr:hypothetical protein HRbin18_00831 [bacterium HR18]
MKMDVSRRSRRRVWAGLTLVLLLPWLAMQFTDAVSWSLIDFGVAAFLLAGLGLTYEVAVRFGRSLAYRIAVGLAGAAAVLLVWLSLGVGIIGKDGDPANLMYFGVLAIGAIGVVKARFRSRGMAWALWAMALAQGLVTAIACIARLGYPWSGPAELLMLNGFFVGLFALSAWLFQQEAQHELN